MPGKLQKPKADISSKIEKLLRTIEDNLDRQPDNNIVEESVTRSMFGIFARNFKAFKDSQGDIDIILRKYFKQSQILDDVSKIILYFNLPYNPLIKERIEPRKIYPKSNGA